MFPPIMNFELMRVIAVFFLAAISFSCQPNKKNPQESQDKEPAQMANPTVKTNPLKDAYFGETHVHTSSSMDAFIGGNRLTPEDAYRFARGEEVMANGSPHRLKRPLDFCAISDHAEFFGETFTLMNPGTPGYNDPIATQMREADNYEDAMALFVKYVITPARTGGSIHPEFYQGMKVPY